MYVINYAVKFKNHGENFTFIAVVPQSRFGQDVNNVAYSPAPARTFSQNGNLYVEWILSPVKVKEINFTITAEITLREVNSPERITRMENATTAPRQTPSPEFLRAENKIESDAPIIREMANKIGDGENAYITAKMIFDFLVKNMKYRGFVGADNGALAAAKNLRGDCTDYTDLFVALCRAKNIPARHISGWFIDAQKIPGHSWAEFDAPRYGWVPVDLLHSQLGKASFARTPAHYITLSHLRHDEILNGGMLYWWKTQPAELTATMKVTINRR